MLSPDALDTFQQALRITGLGMLGIFVFMALFYGLIELLSRVLKPSPPTPHS
ncbi:MAG: OadG family protein [Phycisphaeraceae bacterium]|nr:OadG family protein [Phycisphaeraceae bacterium]